MVPTSKSRRRRGLLGASAIALMSFGFATASQSADVDGVDDHQHTATPIKHLVVVIGENRTFDHIYATYVPKSDDRIANLLSKGIIKADGSPGPHFNLARQFRAKPPFKTTFYISLEANEKTPYVTLPLPGLNFSPTGNQLADGATFLAGGVVPPFLTSTSPTLLAQLEPSLEADDLALLTTGANGLSELAPFNLADEPDTRIANFSALQNGPFPLRGANLPFDSYTGDTTHRLFEMWQQSLLSG
jgi:phospholipase C